MTGKKIKHRFTFKNGPIPIKEGEAVYLDENTVIGFATCDIPPWADIGYSDNPDFKNFVSDLVRARCNNG